MTKGMKMCTNRRLRIQSLLGTYGAEGKFARTKGKSEHCVVSIQK